MNARPLKLKFAGKVVQHLGLQMYRGPVPAIAELIANAWDANADDVMVSIPLGQKIESKSTITVRDNGHGMKWEDCDRKYMVIGRDARKEAGDRTGGKYDRKRMAHKGLGKLAGFGIAELVEISSVSNGKKTKFVMDFAQIEKLNHGDDYVIHPQEDNVDTTEEDGTTVTLTKLKLKQAIPEKTFMTSMARRFSVLSDKFKVAINGVGLAKDKIDFQVYFPNKENLFPEERTVNNYGVASIPGVGRVKYWIGFTEKPIKDPESRGVTVVARGKLVQDPWFFDFSGGVYGQHGMQYMTGEVEADFLDEKTDFVTTDRSSVLWSMQVPNALKIWGQQKIVDVLSRWADERGKLKLQKIKRETPYLDRIEKFPKRERRELTKVVTKMASIDTIEDERLKDMVKSLINAYENKQLMYMIDEVSSLTPDSQFKLYEILKEFQVLEAVTLAQIVHSHITIIEKFEEMISLGVPEKPDMQNYLKDYPWLIDPTYMGLMHEKQLETILKQKFHHSSKSKESSRRPDFFCLGELGRAFIVEVKRPQEKVGRKEIRQLEDYVDFLRRENKKISDTEKQKTFFGYLIGSEYADDTEGLRDRLRHDGIYLRTWNTLLETANRSHREFFNAVKSKAPNDDPRIKELS